MSGTVSVTGRVLVVIVGALLLLGIVTTPASAEDQRAGSVTIMRVDDPGTSMQSGTAEDRFVVKVPVRAACPGDSLNDDYRVQSFLVPATDDPGTLEYEAVKPAGDGRWALWNTYGSRWVQKATSPNAGPGSPGLIDESPALTMSFFKPGQIPPGSYRIGIACTLGTSTKRYWDAVIDVTSDESVGGPQVRWTVVGQIPVSSGAAPHWLVPAIAAAVLFVLLFVGAWWFLSRPSSSDPSSTGESTS